MSNKRKVAYFYDDEISTFYYGSGHVMKPKRLAMAHSLINHYKLYSSLYVYEPNEATKDDLNLFHSMEYINFLEKVSGKKCLRGFDKKNPHNVGDNPDCPCFPGVLNFSQKSAGGSIDCAYMLNEGIHNTCINWGGGLHHAKKTEASGFCYINDIVLCILILLRCHPRVLYIDIDVHHGDGVEEAFYLTNRVMTVSFHQYGNDFFPGTGHYDSVGKGEGSYYSMNVPLHKGVDDKSYVALFKDIIKQVVDKYQPNAIVLQCGGDSISGDRLGEFNLSTRGHAECVDFTLNLGIPTILLGGGGYNISHTARCWANETAVALQTELDNKMPPNEYSHEFKSAFLHVESERDFENRNTLDYLDKIRKISYERLKLIDGAPGIHVSDEYPDELMFEAGLEYLDMKREMANAGRLDEIGYDVAPKNANCFLTSKPSGVEESFYIGSNSFPSSVLIPNIANDIAMEIEIDGPQKMENRSTLLKSAQVQGKTDEDGKQASDTESKKSIGFKDREIINETQMIIENERN